MGCSADNTEAVDQSQFWDSSGVNWDKHRIGWAIAGGCALLTVLISASTIIRHCRSYTNRREQRQILRILYMPPVYAIISFLSYRFFRSYTYYSLAQTAYEAVTLSAFLLLLIEYVASTASGHAAEAALARKDKQTLPIPFCCWRYRPTKAYFMYSVKWSVLQYVIIRPVASIVGIIAEKLGVLCESEGFKIQYAHLWIEVVNFVSISVALYGLLLFYGLTADELKGRRPMAKFLSIKLIVMFTFYQSFMFGALEGRVIHETEYWTAANIADGLNALAICIEMVFFAILMAWAYTPAEYKSKVPAPPTGIWRPLWDSINYADFGSEIMSSLRFFFCGGRASSSTTTTAGGTATARPGYYNHDSSRPTTTFGEAFGVEGATGYNMKGIGSAGASGVGAGAGMGIGGVAGGGVRGRSGGYVPAPVRASEDLEYDETLDDHKSQGHQQGARVGGEDIRLQPYPFVARKKSEELHGVEVRYGQAQ